MANTYSFGEIGEKIGIDRFMDDDMKITALDDPNQASAIAGGEVTETVTHESQAVAPDVSTAPNFQLS